MMPYVPTVKINYIKDTELPEENLQMYSKRNTSRQLKTV